MNAVRRWHLAHPERVREIKRRSAKKHPRTPEERKRLWTNYVAKHREKMLAAKRERKKRDRPYYAEIESRRRLRKRGVNAESCAAKYEALMRQLFCRWCCCKLTALIRQVDHIIPLSRGGEHKPENLCACCISCNSSKGNKRVEEWLPFQQFET